MIHKMKLNESPFERIKDGTKTKSMYRFYSKEQEKQYGVVGIKIKILNNYYRYTYNKLVRDKIPEQIDKEKRRKRTKQKI